MTPAEFKAWFDGFTEALDGIPSEAQWKRIKERVAAIDGHAVTQQVFVDRYWPRRWDWAPYYGSSSVSIAGVGLNGTTNDPARWTAAARDMPQNHSFDSGAAMYALGKAEAAGET